MIHDFPDLTDVESSERKNLIFDYLINYAKEHGSIELSLIKEGFVRFYSNTKDYASILATFADMGVTVIDDIEKVDYSHFLDAYPEELVDYVIKPDDKTKFRYYNEIRKLPILSAEEDMALAKRCVNKDEAAMRELAESKLVLVAKMVQDKTKERTVWWLDAIQEANLGLVKAVEDYKPEFGIEFITFATLYVDMTIDEYLFAVNPAPMFDMKRLHRIQVLNVWTRLAIENNRRPTYEEVAKITKVSVDFVKEVEAKAEAADKEEN